MFPISRISKDPLVRQAELMDMAQKLFLTKGYQATTIQDIVKQVGVAHGTFYYHYPSKEALVEAIVTRHISCLIQTAQHSESSQTTPLVRLSCFIHLFYQVCYRSDISRLTDILYAEKEGELINRIWRQTNSLIEPVLRPLLEECNAVGVTHIDCISETLWFLGGIIATLLETSTPQGYAHETDQHRLAIKRHLAEHLIESLLGLASGTIDLTVE